MPDGIIVSDLEGRIVYANRQAEQMTGYTREELWRRPIELLVPKRLREIHEKHRQAYFDSHRGARAMGTAEADFQARRKDGSEFSADIALGPIDTPGGRQTVAVIRDITKRKQLESALEHMALHDPLTGLANRTLFFDRLNQAMLSAGRDGKQVALVMMDVDRFKSINDAYGHLVGDQVLRKLAMRLTFPLRASDTIARIGGDEFAWILPKVANRDSAVRSVRRLLRNNIENLVVGPQHIVVGVSTGMAVYPDDGQDTDTLLRNADLALYAAKRKVHAHAPAVIGTGVTAPMRAPWPIVSSRSVLSPIGMGVGTMTTQVADTAQVLSHHLRALGGGQLDEVLDDYVEDSVLITPDGPIKGLRGIRAAFEGFLSGLFKPGTYELTLDKRHVDGEVAYILWHAKCGSADITQGTDTFIVKGGKILVQTFAAKVDPR